ncbi:hypothetical protein BDZ45DRAFT_282424 [Acephala macrosclerotiorum]|nr:hypothetical protein BDZ45DRAFT_282424 [Acephala macrosclerotiorum]
MENSRMPRSERCTPDSSRSIISTVPFPPFIDEMVPLESIHAPRAPPKTFDEMLSNGPNALANPKSKLTISNFITSPQPSEMTSKPPQQAPCLDPNFQHDQGSLVESDNERRQRLELAYTNYTLIQSPQRCQEVRYRHQKNMPGTGKRKIGTKRSDLKIMPGRKGMEKGGDRGVGRG